MEIQLPYVNKFSSIWEYDRAVRVKAINWRKVIGPTCPICGRKGCYREITPYSRNVVELFPFQEGRILVTRFQCRRKKTTFSLLPHQLAPYCRYTIESMLKILLLVRQIRREDRGTIQDIFQELPAESNVTPWLIHCWLILVLRALRRAHATLISWYDLSRIRTGKAFDGHLDEIHDYLSALNPRGPPGRSASIRKMLTLYSRATGHHFLGTSSQQRKRSVPGFHS